VAGVEALLDHGGEQHRLAAAGRAFVCEHHCWDAWLEGLGDLLAANCADGRRGSGC
jgi:hypothetical protein